jgi:hypothetical protein
MRLGGDESWRIDGTGMTNFQLVQRALTELYKAARVEHGAATDNVITARIVQLAGRYRGLGTTSSPMDYSDPASRFGYLYMYVATHGDWVSSLLQRVWSDVHETLGKKVVRHSCIGGGPGSDILGVLKYLRFFGKGVQRLECYLLDCEPGWEGTWSSVEKWLGTSLKVDTTFQRVNVFKPATWKARNRFLKADIFTFSFFVSEVMSLDKDEKLAPFWKHVFSNAKNGAIFLYIDNGSSEFSEYFDRHWRGRDDIEILLLRDDVSIRTSSDEQKSDLGDFLSKFPRSPKLASDHVSYRVLRKK